MKNQNILKPIELNGDTKLKNRIVMAPMTRANAKANGTPSQAMVEYYAKRADAGLIITEGTIISQEATGYENVPGIYTPEHLKAWKKVTHAVHQKGGRIYLQLWHVGRVSHPSFLNGKLPVSASATTMQGRVRRAKELYYGKSREATLQELNLIIEQFALGAKNALDAGFDGVEIHGANGYLIDQFLHFSTNQRTDKYGGSAQNMAQFAIDIVDACIKAIGADRVGIRLSPGAYLNEIEGDVRDAAVFKKLLQDLSNKKLSYVHTGNFDDTVTFSELGNKTMTQFIREHYTGFVIASGGYTAESAEQQMMNNEFDLVAFGKPFIANPDLVFRLKNNLNLIQYESSMLDTMN